MHLVEVGSKCARNPCTMLAAQHQDRPVCPLGLTKWMIPLQVVFHANEPADLLYIVERGVVASAGHLLPPGSILGLSDFMLGYQYGAAGRTPSSGGSSGATSSTTGSAASDKMVWGHSSRTLTYANLLTLKRSALTRCVQPTSAMLALGSISGMLPVVWGSLHAANLGIARADAEFPSCSTLHRYPEAAKKLRRTIVFPLMQVGTRLLCTLKLPREAQTMQAAQ